MLSALLFGLALASALVIGVPPERSGGRHGTWWRSLSPAEPP